MEHHHVHETAAWRSESTKELSHLWDLRMAAAFALGSATVVTHGVVTRRRRRALQAEDDGGDDSAYEADRVERASLVSGGSSLALKDLGVPEGARSDEKVPPRAPRTLASRARGAMFAIESALSTTPDVVKLVDIALFASIAWGIMYVGHDKLCGVVMRCECNFPWAGGWSRCNAHNSVGGPRCPWCTAPYWVSVLTQKSCAIVMILAYAVGFGAASNTPNRVASSCASCVDASRASCVAASRSGSCVDGCVDGCGSSAPLLFAVARCCEGLTTSRDLRRREEGREAIVGDSSDKDTGSGSGEDTGSRSGSGEASGKRRSATSALVRRIVVAFAVWFCVEMFWQAFFWLWLGAAQDPVYPCFLICWDSPSRPGNNPPSPLSMADAPPMRRFYDDVMSLG